MALTAPVMALDVMTSFGGGAVIQDGATPALTFNAGFKVPVYTKNESGLQVYSEGSVLWSDRSVNGLAEFQGLTEAIYVKKLVYKTVYIGTGTGLLQIVNSDGSDEECHTYGIITGFTAIGLDISLGCDIFKLTGPDAYYPYARLKILGL
jgi:hypothetical protein